jgi:hypothetical protein
VCIQKRAEHREHARKQYERSEREARRQRDENATWKRHARLHSAGSSKHHDGSLTNRSRRRMRSPDETSAYTPRSPSTAFLRAPCFGPAFPSLCAAITNNRPQSAPAGGRAANRLVKPAQSRAHAEAGGETAMIGTDTTTMIPADPDAPNPGVQTDNHMDAPTAWEDPDMAYLIYKQQYCAQRGRSRVLTARNVQRQKERQRQALNTPLVYECILPLSRDVDLYARYNGCSIEKTEFRRRT